MGYIGVTESQYTPICAEESVPCTRSGGYLVSFLSMSVRSSSRGRPCQCSDLVRLEGDVITHHQSHLYRPRSL